MTTSTKQKWTCHKHHPTKWPKLIQEITKCTQQIRGSNSYIYNMMTNDNSKTNYLEHCHINSSFSSIQKFLQICPNNPHIILIEETKLQKQLHNMHRYKIPKSTKTITIISRTPHHTNTTISPHLLQPKVAYKQWYTNPTVLVKTLPKSQP